MDAAAAFCLRDALDAVDSAFPSQAAVDILSADGENDFLVASELGGIGADLIDLPMHGLGVVGVHPVEVGSEQGRFFSACSGADLHDDVLALKRIRRNQEHLAASLALFYLLLENRYLFLCHCSDFFIISAGQDIVVLQSLHQRLEVGQLLDYGYEVASLKHEALVLVHVLHDLGVGEPDVKLLQLFPEILKFLDHHLSSGTKASFVCSRMGWGGE